MTEPLEFTAEVRFREETEPGGSRRWFRLVGKDGLAFATYRDDTLATLGVTVPPPLPVKHTLIVEQQYELTEDQLIDFAIHASATARAAARAKCDELGIDWKCDELGIDWRNAT